MNQPLPRRLHIERLELDLRGVDPAAAEAAVRALGPALARALSPLGDAAPLAPRLDADSVSSPASPVPADLAATIAHAVAQTLARRAAGSTP